MRGAVLLSRSPHSAVGSKSRSRSRIPVSSNCAPASASVDYGAFAVCGKTNEIVTPVHRSFSEGQETLDLIEARALVEELG